MANEKPPGGGSGPDSNSNKSALERYLAKQKKDREALQRPQSGAASSEQRSGVRSQFKHTDDPMSIPRPPRETPEQPPDLGRWEKVAEGQAENDRFANQRSFATDFGKQEVDEERDVFQTRPISEANVANAQAFAQDRAQRNSQQDASFNTRVAGEFGSRLLATIVDMLILGAISYPAQGAVTAVLALAFGPIVDRHLDGLQTVISAAVVYAYYGYFYSQKGASPGKLLLNIEVIDSETGGRLSPWKAFFREGIGKFISAIPFFMGYIIVMFRDDRRALHDLLFDTQVVVKKP
jgi:uncharacterized RDD family membrane protein YckC